MRRIVTLMLVALVATAAHAQFEKGKYYMGASLSGLSLSYNGDEETHFGLDAKGGYMFQDEWMVTGQIGYDKQHGEASYLKVGVGARYYLVKNGLYFGLGVSYLHSGHTHDDFMPGVQIGYAFFISRTVTIEPEIYYDQSFKDHSEYSTVGLRVGFGVYL